VTGSNGATAVGSGRQGPLLGHGGADAKIIGEFLRYARDGDPIATSAIAARESVAKGL